MSKNTQVSVPVTPAAPAASNLEASPAAPAAPAAPVFRSGESIADDLIAKAVQFTQAAASGKASDATGVSVDGLKAIAIAVVFPNKLGDNYGTPALSKSGAIQASPARTLALASAFAQADASHALEAGGAVNNILRKLGADPDKLPFTRSDKRDQRTGKQAMTLAPRWAAAAGDKATGM